MTTTSAESSIPAVAAGSVASLPHAAHPSSPSDSAAVGGASRLQMWVQRPDARTTVLGVSGEADVVTTPRLAELLPPRLEAAVDTIVVDLSRVRFLGTAALHILVRAHLRAHTRGVRLRLVSGPAAVERGLRAACRAAGLPGFATYSSLDAALTSPVEVG